MVPSELSKLFTFIILILQSYNYDFITFQKVNDTAVRIFFLPAHSLPDQ